jgi:DNA topoisomerase I
MIGSDDINAYLQDVSGKPITTKNFRAWAATNLAALALQELERFDPSWRNSLRQTTSAI